MTLLNMMEYIFLPHVYAVKQLNITFLNLKKIYLEPLCYFIIFKSHDSN